MPLNKVVKLFYIIKLIVPSYKIIRLGICNMRKTEFNMNFACFLKQTYSETAPFPFGTVIFGQLHRIHAPVTDDRLLTAPNAAVVGGLRLRILSYSRHRAAQVPCSQSKKAIPELTASAMDGTNGGSRQKLNGTAIHHHGQENQRANAIINR